MELSDITKTIKVLNKSGVGTDELGYELFLFQQLPCRIISHKVPEEAVHSGVYYIEGDVTEFFDGYEYFWVEGRTLDESNIFEIVSATYVEEDLWTELVVKESASYKVEHSDDNKFVCGRFNISESNRLKSIGDIISQMHEEGSLGNISADKFDFSINDQDRAFYDKVNRSGYFYTKEVFTEIESIQSNSKYSFKSNVYTTFVKVKDLLEYSGGDFVYGFLEVITGESAGNKYVVVSSNGNNLKVLGHLSKERNNTAVYHSKLKIGDKVRVFKSTVYWSYLAFWVRSALDEKFIAFSGKVDLNTVDVDDVSRTLSVTAYNASKDLFDKHWGDLDFDSGTTLPRLTEVQALFLDAGFERIRVIGRELLQEDILSSVKIQEVGFDVAEGWHALDYCPTGLFRFDLGKWYHVYDEGSFEKNTNSVFLASNEDSSHFDNYSKLPDHSTDPSNNLEIERKWHGGWCKIGIDVTDELSIGATNREGLNVGNSVFRKLANLPTVPCKMLFFVNEDRKVTESKIFIYRFDNGNAMIPNYLFDLILEQDTTESWAIGTGYRDLTYPVNFGSKLDANYHNSGDIANYPIPWRYEIGASENLLKLFCFNKFNGMLLNFRNEKGLTSGGDTVTSGYDDFVSHFLQHMSIRYSNGGDGETGFQGNINPIYAGGYHNDATPSDTNIVLNTIQSISRDGGIAGVYDSYQADMVNMRLLCISASNFLISREIKSVAENAGSVSGELLDIVTDPFPSNIVENDRFLVINKNFDIRFIDFGDGLKSGMDSDVLAIFRPRSYQAGTYYEDLKIRYTAEAVDLLSVKPLDQIFIGHRSKFNSIDLKIGYNTCINEDYHDISWFLKKEDFIIEYYDGYNWKPAHEVSILPTTAIGLDDDYVEVNGDDDLVRYRIAFKTMDWHTGGYDSTSYADSLSQAPSAIDEDKIYLLRVTILSEQPIHFSGASISDVMELNCVICWKEIPGWNKNAVAITDGKYWVDTLQESDVVLELYGIELQCRQSLTWLRQARPVNKIIGANGDELYAAFNYREIDEKYYNDAIVYNKGRKNGISTIPKNINYIHLLDKILKSIDFIKNKDMRLHLDDYSDLKKDYFNVIGTNYDGVLPTDIGWDEAVVPELLEDYDFEDIVNSHKFRQVSVIRDNGRYFAYAVNKGVGIRDTIDIFVSTDLKDWAYVQNSSLLSEQINAIRVVKNKDDDNYTIYVSAYDTDRYRVYVGVSSTPTGANIATPDVTAYVEIISDASYNFGACDVLHLKGDSQDTAGAGIRLMCVIKYDDLNLDADGYPTDDPYLEFYLNEDEIDNTAHWVHKFQLAGARGTDPNFIFANFAKNDNTYTENALLNHIILLFKGTDDKIYRTSPRIDTPITSVWEYPNAISQETIGIIGWCCVRDNYLYRAIGDGARDAFTIVPTYRDGNVIIGVDSTGDFKAFAIDKSGQNFDEDLFWISKKQEMNEVDWFKSDTERIVFSNASGTDGKHKRIYLGLRKQFNKILPRFVSPIYSDRVAVRYWDGISWQNIGRAYQNGRTITDGRINPLFGFYYDMPVDWRSDSFENVTNVFSDSGLNKITKSLYWLEISLPADSESEIQVKGFRNCYTNVFAWKNRTLFMMENWSYMKPIYTFKAEGDKNIKIDSLSYDKSEKYVTVNLAEDSMYTSFLDSSYRTAETYIFDVFGVFKNSYPLWSKNQYSDNEYHFLSKCRPATLVRVGAEQELDIGAETFKLIQAGAFDPDFIQEVYYGSSNFSGYEKIGYNLPNPKNQILRKYWVRGSDWETTLDHWKADFLNNIWIARRSGILHSPVHSVVSPYRYGSSYAYMMGSLTQVGLLWEELINAPFKRIDPGFYAFLEKDYLTRYEGLVQDIEEILDTDYPAAPADGEVWLIWGEEANLHADFMDENYSLLQYHSADGGYYTFSRPYKGMIVKDLSDSDQLYVWTGYNWLEITSDILWNGKVVSSTTQNRLFLEWNIGNVGVNIPYFRDWDVRPERFITNNTLNYDHKKRNIAFRDLSENFLSSLPFGGRGSYAIQNELRVTCAVELKDCSAIKDSLGDESLTEDDGYDTETIKVIEPSAPAIAFGMYAFKDSEADDAVIRDDEYTTNPYAYSGIGLYKCSGRVRNWYKAFYNNGAARSDITDIMNYKILDNDYAIGAAKYIELCSTSRYFGFVMSLLDTADLGVYTFEYLAKDDSWKDIFATFPTAFVEKANYNRYSTFKKETWSYKTEGTSIVFDPFIDDWQQNTVEGTEGYWIRIGFDSEEVEKVIRWIVLSGTMLWDNVTWWEDYDIISSKAPTSLTDANKRFFDTYIPTAIEYDEINKRLVGGFWNYDPTVNKYYPFKICFDKELLYNSDGEYFWSWEHNDEMLIVDSDLYDYTKCIKSLAQASATETKLLCVNNGNEGDSSSICSLKNLKTGDKLFPFDVQ